MGWLESFVPDRAQKPTELNDFQSSLLRRRFRQMVQVTPFQHKDALRDVVHVFIYKSMEIRRKFLISNSTLDPVARSCFRSPAFDQLSDKMPFPSYLVGPQPGCLSQVFRIYGSACPFT